MSQTIDRRSFLKASTLAAGALATGAAPAIARVRNANERITLGYIGTGRMGRGNIGHALATGRVDIAALCDVYGPNLRRGLEIAIQDRQPDTHHDFREILDRKDIDAVVISSPDHWHAAQTILACESGKDVFVEKPLATSIGEGRKMVEVARRTGRVVQVGTMQRSAEHFQRAVEIVRSGALGKITFVRCWNASNEYPDGFGNPPDGNAPADLDWDLWLGPAPWHAFNANRFGVSDDRFSTFRYFWDYAGGMLTDWGVHLIDIVLWAMEDPEPLAVTTSGGKYLLRDNRDTPDTLLTTFEFEDWLLTYTNQACNQHGFEERGYGILFHGTDGTLFVDRSGFHVIPEYERDDDGFESRPKTAAIRGSRTSSGNRKHHQNWLDCIVSREQPICDIEIGHRSTNLPHLGNIAYRTRSRIEWNAETERCGANEAANALLSRTYRAPWTL